NEEDEYEAWKRSEPIASEGVDPIKYWVGLRDRYPSLSKFAIDMLSIPGSSCECERLFSELGDLLEPRRRSISPQLLAAIQCDRRWIRAGFGSGEVPVKEAISDEEMDAKYANPSEPSELLASAQLAEQANWLSSLSLLIDICGNKRSVVTYRITGGEEFNFLLCVATDTPWMLECAVTEKVTEEIKMADFEGPDIDDRFRRLLRLAKPIKWGLFHHKHTSTYYRDRVVLMGDSAHASLPFQAAGAAQGLEDALILSAVFGELPTAPQSISSLNSYILAAFDAYDSVRRPRAQKQLDRAAEVGDMVFFRDQERGSDMGKILPRLQDA
ncbi:UbiH 2-polyprenyl-6-methoxyphenol hydroxylase, partial [Pyrenophora tritici-repentis]